MKRHPNISVRTSEHVTAASACISEQDIKKWFEGIKQYLKEEGLYDILSDPTRIFNGDETGFSLCPKTKAVLAPKGCKDVYEVSVGNSKENLTVMFVFSAAGVMCHPMVVYNYKRIPQNILKSVPTNWGIGLSDSGWMKSETFYEFIANIFHPFLLQNNIKLPVILFVDGHKSHLTYQLSTLCSDLQIILVALYPNSTRILQPADVAAFRPLKEGWKRGVFEWRKQNYSMAAVTKVDFAPILQNVIKETITPDILKNGFRACGLYIWNPNNINFDKCLGKNLVAAVDEHCLTENNLNFDKLCDIIGPEIVTKCNSINDSIEITPISEELQALMNVYNLLKEKSNNKGEICIQHQDDIIIDNLHEDNIIIDNQNQDDIIIDNLFLDDNNYDSNMFCVDQNDMYVEQSTSAVISPENNIDISITADTNVLQESEDKIITPRVKIKKLQVSPIDTCLIWPITPERKGKRNTERVPFVISSDKWQRMYEKKEQSKRNIIELKENRKKQRLESKLTKNKIVPVTKSITTRKNVVRNIFTPLATNKKPAETITSGLFENSKTKQFSDVLTLNTNECSNKSSSSSIYKNTGLCFRCGHSLNDVQNGLSCEFCSYIYHLKCLDKNEICNEGSMESILFICNSCQKNLTSIPM